MNDTTETTGSTPPWAGLKMSSTYIIGLAPCAQFCAEDGDGTERAQITIEAETADAADEWAALLKAAPMMYDALEQARLVLNQEAAYHLPAAAFTVAMIDAALEAARGEVSNG